MKGRFLVEKQVGEGMTLSVFETKSTVAPYNTKDRILEQI